MKKPIQGTFYLDFLFFGTEKSTHAHTRTHTRAHTRKHARTNRHGTRAKGEWKDKKSTAGLCEAKSGERGSSESKQLSYVKRPFRLPVRGSFSSAVASRIHTTLPLRSTGRMEPSDGEIHGLRRTATSTRSDSLGSAEEEAGAEEAKEEVGATATPPIVRL